MKTKPILILLLKAQHDIIRVHWHVFLSRYSKRHALSCGLVGFGSATTFDKDGSPGLPLAATWAVDQILAKVRTGL